MGSDLGPHTICDEQSSSFQIIVACACRVSPLTPFRYRRILEEGMGYCMEPLKPKGLVPNPWASGAQADKADFTKPHTIASG
jgi:hypothetical protein